jgi:hypothetical protein
MRLTAIIEREDAGYVALCPELDIASQGASVEESLSRSSSKPPTLRRLNESSGKPSSSYLR